MNMPDELKARLIEYVRAELARAMGDYYVDGLIPGEALLRLLDDPLLDSPEHQTDLEERKADQLRQWEARRLGLGIAATKS